VKKIQKNLKRYLTFEMSLWYYPDRRTIV